MRSVFFIISYFLIVHADAQFIGGPRDGYGINIITGLRVDGALVSNTPLFQGGHASGHTQQGLSGSLTSSGLLNIHNGGIADGHGVENTTTLINSGVLFNLYNGSNGDGFSMISVSSILEGDYTAFEGGIGDGVSTDLRTTLLASSLVMYDGGNLDGYSLSGITVLLDEGATANIYNGGNMDGTTNTLVGSTSLTGVSLDLFTGGLGDGNSAAIFNGFFLQALPVNLISFEAVQQDRVVLLLWSTASEINNERFEIERSSDGLTFKQLGVVNGAGTSFDTRHYESTDEQPLLGLNYYRLKQVDFDGQFSYSPIRQVDFNLQSQLQLSIYPNPNKLRKLQIHLEGISRGDQAQLAIYNQHGQLLMDTFIEPDKMLEIPWTWPQGLYNLKVKYKDYALTRKLLIVD